MLIIILIIASLLLIGWLLLLGRVAKEDWVHAVHAKIYDNRYAIKKLHAKSNKSSRRLAGYFGAIQSLVEKSTHDSITKNIIRLEKDVADLQIGNIKCINIFLMPGYVLQREFVAIGKGEIHKLILTRCYEMHGKKYATCKAKKLLAQILSLPLIGIACILILGVIILGVSGSTIGMSVIAIGLMLMLTLVYAMYDELNDLVKKRRKAISKQFPNVVSKLALLVTSGMIMERAWKETAYSQETELYKEMQKTSEELDNLVSPESAYSNFINRCNTKESAKLASAIMQNLSKGNAEIGKLLKDMAREAWQERRHTAKRDAEKANSKLMIPTMLLFLAILVMLMVPIAMNFSGI